MKIIIALTSFLFCWITDAQISLPGWSPCTTSVVQTNSPSPSPPDLTHLQAWFTFDNTVNDNTGNGNTLTAVGSPGYMAGKITNAISLNGSSQYADRNGLANFTSSPFTIIFWVYVTSFADSPVIVGNGTANVAGWYFQINTTSDGYFVFNQSGADQFVQYTTSAMSINTWYSVACVRNGANATVYINNVNSGSISSVSNPTSASTSFLVGVYNSGTPSNWLNGGVDDLLIYNADETANLTAIYNAQLAGLY